MPAEADTTNKVAEAITIIPADIEQEEEVKKEELPKEVVTISPADEE